MPACNECPFRSGGKHPFREGRRHKADESPQRTKAAGGDRGTAARVHWQSASLSPTQRSRLRWMNLPEPRRDRILTEELGRRRMLVFLPRNSIEKRRYISLEDQGCRPRSTARYSRAGALYRGDDRPAEQRPLVAYRHNPLECSDGTTTLASDEDTPRTAAPEMEREPIQVRAGGAYPEDRPDRAPFLAEPSKYAVAAPHTLCQVQPREHRLVFQAQADFQVGTLPPNRLD